MNLLQSFGATDLAGKVRAALEFPSAGKLNLRFEWEPSWFSVRSVDAPGGRTAELWKSTCFEAFVRPEGADAYWEINLSPDGRWNVYRFESYRKPAPPREAADWKLIRFHSEAGRLQAELHGTFSSGARIVGGLCCIIHSGANPGTASYFALNHPAAKPDFHDARSFLIERTAP